jgi:fructosamine-3-kinase
MNLPAPVVEWSRAGGHGDVQSASPIGGGCIHTALRLTTASGATFFLKSNPDVPADMFPTEAEGLRTLASAAGPRVPEPLLWGADFLLLEDLEPGRPAAGFWERLGRELAGLHGHTSRRFGFDHDNYLGLTPQPNPWSDDGARFFAEHRLRFQARRADAAGLLEPDDLHAIDSLCDRLDRLVPAQPASLLHGDLWSGNVMPGPGGEPCLVDPACHYGWAEAELGMTELFGGFPDSFYGAYQECRPLEPGWRQRLPIYNLYHLLNHLNLFGRSYLGPARSVLHRFASAGAS